MLKKFLKNQKGLTLIELLVVVVILGIIAAIAVPAVGAMINNSKVDAHLANAQQMLNSARLYVASEGVPADGEIELDEHLIDGGYLEVIENPFTNVRYTSGSVTVSGSGGNYTYTVSLPDDEEGDYSISGETQDKLSRSLFN